MPSGGGCCADDERGTAHKGRHAGAGTIECLVLQPRRWPVFLVIPINPVPERRTAGNIKKPKGAQAGNIPYLLCPKMGFGCFGDGYSGYSAEVVWSPKQLAVVSLPLIMDSCLMDDQDGTKWKCR